LNNILSRSKKLAKTKLPARASPRMDLSQGQSYLISKIPAFHELLSLLQKRFLMTNAGLATIWLADPGIPKS
jgi:hypothetical protein